MAVSTIDPNGLNIGQIGGTRNKIINGAMTIDQRNAGALRGCKRRVYYNPLRPRQHGLRRVSGMAGRGQRAAAR
jgi:hypothetical protein